LTRLCLERKTQTVLRGRKQDTARKFEAHVIKRKHFD